MAQKAPTNFTSISRPYNELMERSPNSVPSSDIALGRMNLSGGSNTSFPFNTSASYTNSANGSDPNIPPVTSDAGLNSGVGIGTNIEGGMPTIQNPSQQLPGTTQGSSLQDLFIETWMRSRTWQPKAAGFYIDGRTGYAEFRDLYSNNIVVEGGKIGGWLISKTQIYSSNIFLTSGGVNQANISVGTGANTAGMNAAGGAGDIAFWAGSSFADRATAPFHVTAGGSIFAVDGQIGGSTLSPTAITAGIFQTASDPGQRVEMNGATNQLEVYNPDNTLLANLGGQVGFGSVLNINRTASATTDPVINVVSAAAGVDSIVRIIDTSGVAAITALGVLTNSLANDAAFFYNSAGGVGAEIASAVGAFAALSVTKSGGGLAAEVFGTTDFWGVADFKSNILVEGGQITLGGKVFENSGGHLHWGGVLIPGT